MHALNSEFHGIYLERREKMLFHMQKVTEKHATCGEPVCSEWTKCEKTMIYELVACMNSDQYAPRGVLDLRSMLCICLQAHSGIHYLLPIDWMVWVLVRFLFPLVSGEEREKEAPPDIPCSSWHFADASLRKQRRPVISSIFYQKQYADQSAAIMFECNQFER